MPKKGAKPLVITPLESVGPIKLEMSRKEIHKLLGRPDSSFGKGRPDEQYQDFWDKHDLLAGHGIKVSYDREDIELVEVTDYPRHDVEVLGIPVLAVAADDVVQRMISHAPYWADDPEIPYSFLFPELELALWRGVCPEPEDKDEEVPPRRPTKFDNYAGWFFQTVGAGPRGYADKIKKIIAGFKKA